MISLSIESKRNYLTNLSIALEKCFRWKWRRFQLEFLQYRSDEESERTRVLRARVRLFHSQNHGEFVGRLVEDGSKQSSSWYQGGCLIGRYEGGWSWGFRRSTFVIIEFVLFLCVSFCVALSLALRVELFCFPLLCSVCFPSISEKVQRWRVQMNLSHPFKFGLTIYEGLNEVKSGYWWWWIYEHTSYRRRQIIKSLRKLWTVVKEC